MDGLFSDAPSARIQRAYVIVLGGIVASMTPFLFVVPFAWVGAMMLLVNVSKGEDARAEALTEARIEARVHIKWMALVIVIHVVAVVCLYLGRDTVLYGIATFFNPPTPEMDLLMQSAAAAERWIDTYLIANGVAALTAVALLFDARRNT